MSESLTSELLGTAGLMVAAGVALLFAILRRPVAGPDTRRPTITTLFLIAVLFQSVHAGEEFATRFYERFPESLGLTPWSAGFFLTFNLTWLAIWMVAAIGLRAGYRPAYFPVWFLAIADMANGIVHPLLALLFGGYFPGLVTSPVVGITGVVLFRGLMVRSETTRDAEGIRRPGRC